MENKTIESIKNTGRGLLNLVLALTIKSSYFVAAVILLAAIALSATNTYALGNLMALQGYAEDNGNPINNGNLVVTIYDAPTGGALIYNSGIDFNGAVNDGRFDVVLGSGSNELVLNYGQNYYLDISVNGVNLDFNDSDRKIFQSSVGNVSGSLITANSITGSRILDSTITNADISDSAAIDKSKISTTGTWADSEIPSLTGSWANTVNGTRIVSQNMLNVNSSSYALYLGGYDADVFLRNDTSLSSRINLLSSGSAAAGNCSSGQYAQNITPNGVECRVPEAQNPFNQTVNTSSNVIFKNISATNISAQNLFGSLNWSYLTSVPSFILDYTTNLSDRLNKSDQRFNETGQTTELNTTRAMAGNCSAGQYAQNITALGIQCSTPQPSNPFNQNLNTTNNVTFTNVTSNDLSANNLYGNLKWTYLTSIPYNVQDTINLTDRLNKSDQRFNETLRVDDLNNTKAAVATCADGTYVVNTTSTGTQCATPPPTNPFNQALNTSSNITVYNITAKNISAEYLFGSLGWSNLTGVPSYVLDYRTNLTDRLNKSDQRYNSTGATNELNLTRAQAGNCSDGQYPQNITALGVQCVTPQPSNPFNQALNSSSNVTLYNITAKNISAEYLFGSLGWSNLTNIPYNVKDTINLTDKLNKSDQRFNETARLDDMNNTKAQAATCSDGTFVVNATNTTSQCAGPATAGSTGQIQYKSTSAGVLSGMAYAQADSSGYLTIPNTTTPTTPTTGVTVFASNRGDDSMLAVQGISGATDYPGPAVWSQDVGWCAPAHTTTGVTTLACWGLTLGTTVGVVSNPAPAAGYFQNQMTRTTSNSTALANAGAEFKGIQLNWWRGNAAGFGGFKFVWRGSWSNISTNGRGCVGMFGSTAAISVANAINASINDVYAGFDSTQTALRICSNDGAGTSTCVSCGANFPVGPAIAAEQAVYEVSIFTKPNSAQYTVNVKRLDSSVTDCNATISSNIPANTQFLTWHVFCNNGGDAAGCAVDVNKVYLETT